MKNAKENTQPVILEAAFHNDTFDIQEKCQLLTTILDDISSINTPTLREDLRNMFKEALRSPLFEEIEDAKRYIEIIQHLEYVIDDINKAVQNAKEKAVA
ncbi:hypothetical protein WJR50_11465 [Catalinimonas sp. 4WD22]|uniref:hypothetical protein n=1 Tax=Catalinimonas locisalis TaxID=3133978 RepID=UPI003101712E